MFFRKIVSLWVLLPLVIINKLAYSWHKSIDFHFEIQPEILLTYFDKNDVRIFESVYGSRDYFALLSSLNRNNYFDLTTDNSFLLIGARNYLYQLSVPDLTPNSFIRWTSSQIDKMKCINRSVVRNKDECDNYIKLYLKLSKNTIKICSTNALNPKCRYYLLKEDDANENLKLQVVNETSGVAYSPLKAYENKYFYNYNKETNSLYTGNSIDLNRYFTSVNRMTDQDRLTTNVDDNNWLYRAEFLNSFTDDERIFIIFNEDKVIDESSSSANAQNQVPQRIPRIAHLCLNDRGASLNSLRNIWTTYLKSKLTCFYDTTKNQNKNKNFVIEQMDSFNFDSSSYKSSMFYFDEIKATSELHRNKLGKAYFYATFSTSSSQITASAICRFTMDQIMDSFHGNYKSNSNSAASTSDDQSNKQQQQHVPDPRPSHCPNQLTYQHLIFSRKNFIMEQDIESEALIVESSLASQFVSIDVDFQVNNLDNSSTNDVLFVGTDDGRVLSFVVKDNVDLKQEVIYSEKLNIFDEDGKLAFNYTLNSINIDPTLSLNANMKYQSNDESIINLKYLKNENQSHLIMITQNRVISLPWLFCDLKKDATRCNNTLYPYCVWSVENQACVSAVLKNRQTADELESLIINRTSLLDTSHRNRNYDLMEKNSNNSNYLANNLFKKFTDLSSLNSYTIRNNEITISMNLALFSTILILLLIFSLIFAVLMFLAISEKFSKYKNNTTCCKKDSAQASNKKAFADFNLNSLKELFTFLNANSSKNKNEKIYSVEVSPQPSQILESSISYSPQNDKYLELSKSDRPYGNETNKNERYICLNSSKPLCLNILELNGHSKFLDYDQTEYYSLKKSKKQNNGIESGRTCQNLIKLQSATSSSTSNSSSPKSATSSSSLSKSTFINNDDSIKSSLTLELNHNLRFENNTNKYYL